MPWLSGREVGLVDVPLALLGGRTVDVIDAAQGHRSERVKRLAVLEAAIELDGDVDIARPGRAFEVAGLADVGVDLAVFGKARVELRLLGAVRPELARLRIAIAFEQGEIALKHLTGALSALGIDRPFVDRRTVVGKPARLTRRGRIERRLRGCVAGR